MMGSPWLLIVSSILHFIVLVQGNCTIPQHVEIKETSPPGFLLVNSTVGAGDHPQLVHVSAASTTVLSTEHEEELKRDYFNATQYNGYFTVTLAKTLDLEYFYNNWTNTVLTHVRLDFTCGRSTFLTIISNAAVNEFPPVFNQSSYTITIPESAAVGEMVFNLTDMVNDKDVGELNQRLYRPINYTVPELDGHDKFSMPIETSGHIVLSQRQIDFDTLGRKYFMLNITVKDNPNDNKARFGWTALNISISDTDDQAPEFVKPGCRLPCTAPQYLAITTEQYTGELTVSPGPIHAIDHDTLGTPLTYSIKSGNEDGLFSLGQKTGLLSQHLPVGQLEAAEFRLVIEVRKDIQIDLSAIAILTIGVEGRVHEGFPTISTVPTSDDGGGTDLLIPLVVLGVVLVLMVVLIVTMVLIIRHKLKQALVRPAEDDVISDKVNKSEPATEEEELFSDRSGNDVLTVGSDAMFTTMTGKARHLPPLPLRDTGTETETVGKKKRSRRRKKKKLTEIFDGTQEYNMGADPGFFDSTDKSKVKRSQRSYDKKTDPLYWIKVPNDNESRDS